MAVGDARMAGNDACQRRARHPDSAPQIESRSRRQLLGRRDAIRDEVCEIFGERGRLEKRPCWGVADNFDGHRNSLRGFLAKGERRRTRPAVRFFQFGIGDRLGAAGGQPPARIIRCGKTPSMRSRAMRRRVASEARTMGKRRRQAGRGGLKIPAGARRQMTTAMSAAITKPGKEKERHDMGELDATGLSSRPKSTPRRAGRRTNASPRVLSVSTFAAAHHYGRVRVHGRI